MTQSFEAQDGPYQPFNDAIRLAALEKLPSEYAAAPERYERAITQAQALSPHVRESFPGVEEGTPEGQLLERSLTMIFFAFSNPDQPDDTPNADQMGRLCFGIFSSQPSTLNFAERLDTVASYLYAYSSDVFLGPWQSGVSSSERFDAALERMYAGFEPE